MKNAPIHPLRRLIYGTVRGITALALPIYFRERLVLGKENLTFDGPAIIAVNHPNTLMDVLNPGLAISQEMFFLANYGMFRTVFTNWLFRNLFCIPVMRREDLRPGERRNNAEAFEQSFLHMENHGVLFLAPEGSSWMHRWVSYPLKTGIARIAFGAEDRNDWKLGIKIIPIGLTYDFPHQFRSRTTVWAGEPIDTAAWSSIYREHPNQAVEDLLEMVYARLTSLSLHVENEEGALLLERLEQLIHHPKRQPWKDAFLYEHEHLPGWLLNDELKRRVKAYFDALKAQGLHDSGIARAQAGWAPWPSLVCWLLCLPMALTAGMLWFLPLMLPWVINRLLGFYVGFSSTVKVLSGVVFFPVYFWGLYELMANWLPQPWPAAALLMIVFSGILLERYVDMGYTLFRQLQLRRVHPSRVNALVDMRKTILKIMGAPVGRAGR